MERFNFELKEVVRKFNYKNYKVKKFTILVNKLKCKDVDEDST